MRILLCGAGTSEILWSIHGALVDLGHESVLALPDISQELINGPIDALFVLNLFEIPRDTVEMLIAYVAGFGRRPAVVHICLKHPLEEISAATAEDVRDADRWMAAWNITLWCMCRGTAEHAARLGLTRIVHAPLGLHRSVAALRSGEGDGIALYKRWMSHETPGLVRLPYRAMQGDAGGTDEAAVAGHLLYLGQGWPGEPPDGDTAPARAARAVADAMRGQPALTRIEAIDACGLGDAARDPAWTLAFNRAFTFAFAVENRCRFVVALSRAFGPALSLWGNGWERFGVTAHPVSPAPRVLYRQAAACLDFGSLAFDTAVFPRTLEIVKRGGVLASWRHGDSAVMFGPHESALTFAEPDAAVGHLAAFLEDPDRAASLGAAHADWAFGALGMEGILHRILSDVAG